MPHRITPAMLARTKRQFLRLTREQPEAAASMHRLLQYLLYDPDARTMGQQRPDESDADYHARLKDVLMNWLRVHEGWR